MIYRYYVIDHPHPLQQSISMPLSIPNSAPNRSAAFRVRSCTMAICARMAACQQSQMESVMKAKETAKQFKYLVAMKLLDVIPICKLILTNAGIKITSCVYDMCRSTWIVWDSKPSENIMQLPDIQNSEPFLLCFELTANSASLFSMFDIFLNGASKAKRNPWTFLQANHSQPILHALNAFWYPIIPSHVQAGHKPDAKVGGPGNFNPLRASTKTVST